MSGLDLTKKLGLQSCAGKVHSESVVFSSTEALGKFLHEKFSQAIFVVWQVQSIIWGKLDGEKLLLKDNQPPNFDDWLECRIFNRQAELHLKRAGQNFVGRYICDVDGEEKFYADSFSRLWGKRDEKFSTDGWIKLCDAERKLSMTIPCDDGDKKFYGLLTRNYIGSDEDTGLSGYVDYRFVAIESAWDGD